MVAGIKQRWEIAQDVRALPLWLNAGGTRTRTLNARAIHFQRLINITVRARANANAREFVWLRRSVYLYIRMYMCDCVCVMCVVCV